jgi:hypothetical protein
LIVQKIVISSWKKHAPHHQSTITKGSILISRISFLSIYISTSASYSHRSYLFVFFSVWFSLVIPSFAPSPPSSGHLSTGQGPPSWAALDTAEVAPNVRADTNGVVHERPSRSGVESHAPADGSSPVLVVVHHAEERVPKNVHRRMVVHQPSSTR